MLQLFFEAESALVAWGSKFCIWTATLMGALHLGSSSDDQREEFSSSFKPLYYNRGQWLPHRTRDVMKQASFTSHFTRSERSWVHILRPTKNVHSIICPNSGWHAAVTFPNLMNWGFATFPGIKRSCTTEEAKTWCFFQENVKFQSLWFQISNFFAPIFFCIKDFKSFMVSWTKRDFGIISHVLKYKF